MNESNYSITSVLKPADHFRQTNDWVLSHLLPPSLPTVCNTIMLQIRHKGYSQTLKVSYCLVQEVGALEVLLECCKNQ